MLASVDNAVEDACSASTELDRNPRCGVRIHPRHDGRNSSAADGTPEKKPGERDLGRRASPIPSDSKGGAAKEIWLDFCSENRGTAGITRAVAEGVA
jgi:hypothetical protein